MAVTTWEDNYKAAKTGSYMRAIESAIVSTALDIQSETEVGLSIPAGVPSGITEQELHNRRSKLAYSILNAPSQYVDRFAVATSVNIDLYSDSGAVSVFKASSDTGPTKAEIKNSVSAVFTAIALNCKE